MERTMLASLILLSYSTASALDLDVTFVPTHDPKFDQVEIVYNGCTSSFKFLKRDLSSIESNADALDQMVERAISRAQNGCK